MNSSGSPLHNSYIVISFLTSPTFFVLSFSVIFIFYQGRMPFYKYINTYPSDSKSSLLDNSPLKLISKISNINKFIQNKFIKEVPPK